MYKTLDLHSRLFFHPADLFKGQFPCRHHAHDSLFLQKLRPCLPCNRHLGTCMDREFRQISAKIFQHPDILDDHAVKSPQIIRQKIFIKSLDLGIFKQRIHRQVNASPMDMYIINRLKHLVLIQILRICSRPEPGSADIDRISPRADGRPQTFLRACGSENLNPSFLIPPAFNIE